MPKILIVDDEPHILELARMYLEREGFQVEGVSTGRDALARQAASNPDLIVLDLMLPDIDGFEVDEERDTDYRNSKWYDKEYRPKQKEGGVKRNGQTSINPIWEAPSQFTGQVLTSLPGL